MRIGRIIPLKRCSTVSKTILLIQLGGAQTRPLVPDERLKVYLNSKSIMDISLLRDRTDCISRALKRPLWMQFAPIVLKVEQDHS